MQQPRITLTSSLETQIVSYLHYDSCKSSFISVMILTAQFRHHYSWHKCEIHFPAGSPASRWVSVSVFMSGVKAADRKKRKKQKKTQKCVRSEASSLKTSRRCYEVGRRLWLALHPRRSVLLNSCSPAEGQCVSDTQILVHVSSALCDRQRARRLNNLCLSPSASHISLYYNRAGERDH